jgi:hypothetical protein
MLIEPGVQAVAAPLAGHTVPIPLPVPEQSAPLQQRGVPPACGVHLDGGAHCPRESQRQPWLPTMQVDTTPPLELPPLLPLLPLLLPASPPSVPEAPELPAASPELDPSPPKLLPEPLLPQAAKVSALAPMATARPITR